MKKVLTIVVWFSLLLALTFFSAFFLIGRTTILDYSAKVKPYSIVFKSRDELRRAREGSSNLIIFMGDSSVAQPPWAIKGLPGIPKLLENEMRRLYPELGETRVVEWAFGGARMFHYYCLLFEAAPYKPDLVIVPINWRSLGPELAQWQKTFEFPELSAMVPSKERANPAAKDVFQFEGISRPKQSLYMFYRPTLYFSGLKMWFRIQSGMESPSDPLENLLNELPPAKQLIANFSEEKLFSQYEIRITDDNSQLETMRLLVEAADRLDMKVLFYITPIHIEEMSRRRAFEPDVLRESLGRVTESARSETSVCLNLLGLFGEENFIDCFEHYSPIGNHKVALALAPTVSKILKPADNGSKLSQARPMEGHKR